MIPEEQAREEILERVAPGGVESLEFGAALGRYLGREYRAEVALPGFDNSAMDGYAVSAEGELAAGVELKVRGEQPAGEDLRLSLGEGEAIRIFTGAPIPRGATAVVMQEEVEKMEEGEGTIRLAARVEEGDFIRRAGADLCVGQVMGARGERVTPQLIGLLASQGQTAVEVGKAPSASVVTTGDEVVRGGEGPLKAGEIYNSNGPMLEGLLRRTGAKVEGLVHAGDEAAALEEALGEALERSEVVVIAGGVSVGERDMVKGVLERLGVTTGFWRVRVKPGKPFLFGYRGERLVFGLPGNPVSGYVTYGLFVEPAIRQWMGAAGCVPEGIPFLAGEGMENPGDRPHYVRGRVDWGEMRFTPVGGQRSDALYGLSRAGGLARLEAGAVVREGERVAVYLT